MARNKFLGKKWLLILAAVVAAVGIYLLFFRQPEPIKQNQPKATIEQLPKQPAANGGEKKITNSSGNNQGTSSDLHGEASGTAPASQWVQSSTGVITLKQPVNGSVIKSGSEINGSASVKRVQYRLIDNQRGVISQGFIDVVDGKFAAKISFFSHGDQGRLDIFSTNDEGAEINEVQINVKLED